MIMYCRYCCILLLLGAFSVTTAAQVTTNVHAEGTFAVGDSFSSTTAGFTDTFVSASRNTQKDATTGQPVTTTSAFYSVCVFNFATDIEDCQVGFGQIANDELTGDVKNGLGTPPNALKLEFNSATEPGFTVSAFEINFSTGNFSFIPASPGIVAVSWAKNGLFSSRGDFTVQNRYGTAVMTKQSGKFNNFSSGFSGTVLGTLVGGTIFSEIGSVSNFNLTVVFGPH